MLESVLKVVLEFRYLLIMGVILGGVMIVFGVSMTANLEWTQKRMKVFGVFYNLSNREALWLSAGLLRVLFVAMIACFMVRMEPVHTAFYIALFAAYNALLFEPKRMLFDLLNSGVIYAALLVSNILMGFYRDVSGDARVMAVYVLLAIFVCIYSLYFYVKGIADLCQYKTQPLGGEIDG